MFHLSTVEPATSQTSKSVFKIPELSKDFALAGGYFFNKINLKIKQMKLRTSFAALLFAAITALTISCNQQQQRKFV
jgi:hypothetical protein